MKPTTALRGLSFVLGALLVVSCSDEPMRKEASVKTETPLPFLLEPSGVFDPEMKECKGLAFDGEDRLYVAGADGVVVLDAAGKRLRLIETSGPAYCVAVDEEGRIFAAQRTRVERFDPDGKRAAAWGEAGSKPGQFVYITGLAVADSVIYVADGGARRISRFAINGDFSGEIDKFLIPSPYFDIALDDEGRLYATHTGKHRVEVFDGNMELIAHWGKPGGARDKFSGCCNPTNIAIFKDGRVATTEKGAPRLKVHDAEGSLLAHLGGDTFPEQAAGMDLAIDSKERVALLDPVANRMRFYFLESAGKAATAK